MRTGIDNFFGIQNDNSEFLGLGKKAKASRQAKKELKASGMTGKEARQALKSSPCGKKPVSKSDIDSWKKCLADNGLTTSQINEVEKAGSIDAVTDDQLDNALKIDKLQYDNNSSPKKSNWPLWIGIGFGAVAIIGVSAWLIFRKRK